MNVRLHIDCLVVDAGLAGDHPGALEAAVIAELSRAMGSMPFDPASLLQTGGSLDRLPARMPDLHGPATAMALGTQVGAAIHAGLAGAGVVAPGHCCTVPGELP